MQANDEIPPSETMWAVQQITNQIVYRVANRIRTSPLDHKLFGFVRFPPYAREFNQSLTSIETCAKGTS